jgi:hypothetical protein
MWIRRGVLLAAALAGAFVITALAATRFFVHSGSRSSAERHRGAQRGPATYGPGDSQADARLEGRSPAAPPFVPRGYIPAASVEAPRAAAPLPRLSRSVKRTLDFGRPLARHNPGGVDGDRPPRPVPAWK